MIWNKVILAIAAIGAVCTFIATNSAVTLALLLAIVLVPLSAIASCKLASSRTTVSFSVQPSCTVGQDLEMEIVVQRPHLMRGRMELVIECNNLLLGTVEHVPVSMAPSIAQHERFLMPLGTQRCGHIVYRLESFQVTDMLGFTRCRVAHNTPQASFTVYPQVNDLSIRTERASFTNFSGVTYDNQKKGQDRTEVFEIRGYRKGDSFKSVHWKLSARFDELLIREPSRPAEHNIVLLCDAHAYHIADADKTRTLNATLTVLASVSLALMRQGIDHTVVQSDGDYLHSRLIENRVDFDEMLDELMDLPLSHSNVVDVAPFEMGRTAQTDTKVVIITNLIDETLPAKLCEITDLSVIQVSAAGTAGIDESAGYPLIHLPESAVAETKVLEI